MPYFSDAFAAETCSIEVYPFEGGPYVIDGGQIQAVRVSKSLRGTADGRFEVQLAPGGPAGPEDKYDWSKIVTPMSHVIIGMARGADAAVVMDGVALTPGEGQEWETGDDGAYARRVQTIEGADFSWFFNTFNYYALTFYGLTASTLPGKALNYLPQGLYDTLSQGLIGGTDVNQSAPVQVGRTWYEKVMGGQIGILGSTYLPYKGGSRIPFYQAVGTQWENYPNVFIPYADNFMTGEESWTSKFRSIFPAPWYEFFVTTAPADAYSLVSGATGYRAGGSLFAMQSVPAASPAGPLLVARINPTPQLQTTTSGTTVSPGSLDLARWNALPLYDFTKAQFGFYESQVAFSADAARNFYMLNPTGFGAFFGTNNANNIPAPFSFIAAMDAASVQRYGFRPQLGTTRWLWDPTGLAPQAGLNVEETILQLTAFMIGVFHPMPLMANARVTIPLSPGVLVGTRFRYAPYKDGEPWDFYVEEFEHRFVFGGRSTTTLTLTRGLPASVYADTRANGTLRAVFTGNAQRADGVYAVGLPNGSALPLRFVATPEQCAAINGSLARVFVTPQAKQ